MSTLHEIKAAASTLPADERSELVAWLSEATVACFDPPASVMEFK